MKAFTLLLSLCATAGYVLGQNCKCFPGEDCWPTKEQFDALNATVQGRLIATVPIATECHDPLLDDAACKKLQDGWKVAPTQYVTHPLTGR